MMKNVLLLLAILFASLLRAQVDDLNISEKVDSLFTHVQENAPGYMIQVIKEKDVIFSQGYGLANLEHKIIITDMSAFNIASLSKQFTAAAVAMLILDGKLDLEDDVKPYFPESNFGVGEIKLKHLIYMTSGINDYYYNPRKNNTDWSSLNFFSIDTAIQASFSSELMYKPGSQWSYSNINYMLLTKIVEQVSGVPFSQYVAENIFTPLEMNHTCVNDDIFQVIPNRVTGYNHRDEDNTDWLLSDGYLKSNNDGFLQINRNSPHYGGSGVYTTAEDFSKWAVNFHTKELWGDDFYELMHKTMKFDHDKENDAFGLVHGDFNGKPIVSYEGGDWGFSSFFMRFPEQNITIICFSNLGSGNAKKYGNQIADILIEVNSLKLD